LFIRAVLAAALLALGGCDACDTTDSVEAIYQQQKAGDYEGTLEPLRGLLEARPDDAELNFLYGRALAFTQPHLAIWSLRKSMEDPEWLARAGLQLAFLALATGDYNEVAKIAGQVLEREPENVRARMIRANAYAHSRKDPELALADARRVLELDPNALEAYEPLILALLALDRFDEATEELAAVGRRLVELERDAGILAWHCATTATFEQESGEIDRARATWEKCLEAHPTDADVVSSSVGFFDSQGELSRSLEILKRAQAGDPDSHVFRTTLARRLHGSGEVAEAEALLREVTRSENLEVAVGAWIDLAKLRQSVEEYGAAADALAEAVERVAGTEAPSPQLLFEYADALVLADRLDRAFEVSEQLSVPAHRGLIRGRVAQERGDPALALEEFDEALRLWPDNPWARYFAALAAEDLGDFERALVEYRNAIRIEPGATDARTRAASLLVAQGDLNAASVVLYTAKPEAPLGIEGELLAMRLAAEMGNTVEVAELLATIEARHTAWAGVALSEASEGVARRSGPIVAADMLAKAPGVDFGNPRYVAALRAYVRYAHERGATEADRTAFQAIFDGHPDSSVFQEIRGFDLELAGAPAEAVSAAYTRAVELAPLNAAALAGLGRLALHDDPAAALGFFDRAAAADPTDPGFKLAAARAEIAAGRPEQAVRRLDELLLAHPFEAEAAALRAQLDLDRGVATTATLERARRAARFGGGADALELLSRVHLQRDEPEPAANAAARARALRAAHAPEG
jgi:tetratricopeptide (TPR) repeat protein